MPISRIGPTVVLYALLMVGCDPPLSPDGNSVPADDLTIIAVSPDAPPLLAHEVTFWAVAGEDREVEIRYDPAAGYAGDGKCLRFLVPAGALLRHADGRLIEDGDSVEITIRVVDQYRFLFEFDPSGVAFDPRNPARLEIRYQWAAADQNGDGVVDELDAAITDSFTLWRQERRGDPWTKITATRIIELQELHADIVGFTRYALASDRHRQFQ